MRTITVSNSVTLDGVMQAPGRPDEDRRGGFEHGGWANPYFDPVMIESAGVEMGRGTEMLFGRRTYDDFAGVWPHMPADNPFTKVLNDARKHVVSNSLSEPLAWTNSTPPPRQGRGQRPGAQGPGRTGPRDPRQRRAAAVAPAP